MTTVSAPAIGTLVEYGLNGLGTAPARYRVTSWMCTVPVLPELPEEDWIGRILNESCRPIPQPDGSQQRMRWCLQEEATHLGLSGVCGAIAPIADCKVIGMVNWPASQIDAAHASAVRKGQKGTMLF